ncbi:fibrinogen-like YCDxxxxGGGW domain-containing protein [Kribbella sp. NBC_01245]|uniref:fibrinogen-like YCDxxxxGGGW domain-containing protein n=1 Tax=Kribbella sp. NBC_01245 TaxID=2903578 RepID=UPI002E28000C|nr:fibrinogen-like YCDxxxxGGGW domain-containing protein [Kribbella sp. NBC_01245]
MSTRVLTTRRRSVARAVATALAAVTVGSLATWTPTAVSAATVSSDSVPVPDGKSQISAAASCWEIKNLNPQAADGLYWLQTPRLRAPQQFYCDMTTDGGGWVLVGRGRGGWTYTGEGLGSAKALCDVVTGPAAFGVKQLPNATIDGLLNGTRVDALPDGVRVRRAATIDGSAWQEVRFDYQSRDRWTWAFAAGHPVKSYSFDNNVYTNAATTRLLDGASDLRTVWTYESLSNGWIVGFNYGKAVQGSSSADSYLYSANANGSYATPFSQVWIRPMLRTADLTYEQVPDSGSPEREMKALASSRALVGQWGVTGLGAGGTTEWDSEVAAFAQIGNVVYVGGNFTTVQKGAAAAEKATQSYLAAFDATTGEWIPSFRPVLDNQVKALAALPNGQLAVGGEFTTVNGQPHAALVALDPATGQNSTIFGASIENRLSSGSPVVRSLRVHGGWLYLGGYFTHLKGNTQASFSYARHAGRVRAGDGSADWNWNPDLNGSVNAVDVSADGTRVYLAGYFTASRGVALRKGAAFSTAAGAPLVQPMWNPVWSTGTPESVAYQQAVIEAGDKVWLGGSQHSMFAYDTDDFTLQSATVTRGGGDGQAFEANEDVVYGGCHCGDWAYYGTIDYAGTWPGWTPVSWTQGEEIGFVGAWDARTGEYLPEFTPKSTSNISRGAWAIFQAADETLWVGGTFTSAVTTSGSSQWVGGFMRHPMRDHQAPESPSQLTGTVDGSVAHLSWTESPSAGVTYEVIRDGRVVATTTSTSIDVPYSSGSDRFFVRATDAAGNLSASTTVATLRVAVVASGSAWNYHFDNAVAVPDDWAMPIYDNSGWKSGKATLGWGSTAIATNIDVPAGTTRAITSYHRHAFTVDDLAAMKELRLTTWADDGIVVYLNGVEVGRSNMPDGRITATTYAKTAVTTAKAAPYAIDIDPARLVAGRNVVAVEVHSNYRSTPSTSMDLTITRLT